MTTMNHNSVLCLLRVRCVVLTICDNIASVDITLNQHRDLVIQNATDSIKQHYYVASTCPVLMANDVSYSCYLGDRYNTQVPTEQETYHYYQRNLCLCLSLKNALLECCVLCIFQLRQNICLSWCKYDRFEGFNSAWIVRICYLYLCIYIVIFCIIWMRNK